MFEEIFEKFKDKNKEIKLIGVWGKDGLELEKRLYSDLAQFDMEFAGAELADIITKLESIKLSPENYYIKLNFYDNVLMIFSLTPDFFLMMLADQTVIPGKLVFYLNLYRENLISTL